MKALVYMIRRGGEVHPTDFVTCQLPFKCFADNEDREDVREAIKKFYNSIADSSVAFVKFEDELVSESKGVNE